MAGTEEYAATFELIDTNGDGRIDAGEFRAVMEALGEDVSAEDAAEAVAVIDTDGDGLVTLPELAAYLANPPRRRA